MTRITNFGRKRKYLEAGFATEATTSNEHLASEVNTADDEQRDTVYPKKKRNKTKKSKAGNGDQRQNVVMNQRRDGAKSVGYGKRTERRRLKRIADRLANTVCFACREKGHTAMACPKAGGDGFDNQRNANTVVGMCYRCGSTKHTLSRCKRPEDPLNPLPFASCFVCSGKGHLASACPENEEKGIYPNGGSCKLCGEKTHLARNCELRKKDVSGTATTTIFGTGGGAGADEDDFHTFKRKNAEISKEEKKEGQRRKRLDVKAGLCTGTVKAFGDNPVSSKSKKVVFF